MWPEGGLFGGCAMNLALPLNSGFFSVSESFVKQLQNNLHRFWSQGNYFKLLHANQVGRVATFLFVLGQV